MEVALARARYPYRPRSHAWFPCFSAVVALGTMTAPARADRTATYLPGTITFSQNVALRAPVATRDGEPSIRVDVRGNCYAAGIRGVPAGVDLWRFDLNRTSPNFDPGMQSPKYLGQPDAFLPQDPQDPTTGGADGGGDVDISVSFPNHPDSIPVVTFTSLAVANIASAFSFDRGENFTLSPATVAFPGDDRQWNESTGHSRVYCLYRAPIPATGLFMQRSEDHGLTWNPVGSLISTGGTSPAYLDVDHTTGRVYAAHQSGAQLRVSRSTDSGATWATSVADGTTGHGSLFDVVKVGDDGTVYAVWSDQVSIYLSHSTDGGINWAQKVRVNDDVLYKTNLMPWLEAGSDGRVCVVWYGSTAPANGNDADWNVLYAQTLDAESNTPTFRQQVISDHLIHGSNVSLLGLGGNANRNLIDLFQVALDPQGAAVVAFTDDHNDFDGHTYVTRQLDGPSLYASANGNGTVDAMYPPPLPPQDFLQPEVTDFLHDATTGLLQPIPADNAFDILWIDYSCEDPGSDPRLVATMKLSSLAAIPPGVQWRVNFTANAPGTSPGVPGLSDRGQAFWMRAGVDTQSVQSFSWGTAVRAGDGSTTYTERGPLDFGMFDQANGTLTMKVRLTQLNPFASPDIATGSILCGLRGQTLEPGFEGPPGNRHPFRDHTRGGGTFTYPACGTTATVLAMFRAEAVEEGVRLMWSFGPGASFTSLDVERADAADGPWERIEVERSETGAVASALDRGAVEGRSYHYRLVAFESDGTRSIFGPIAGSRDAIDLASAFAGAPTPNPARIGSSIRFRVGAAGFVDLAVLDPTGRRVRTVHAGPLAPGVYTRVWDGRTDRYSDAPAGIYFFVLNTPSGVKSQRMVLTR
jgi:flagellar hook capping protein FlgD